MSGGSWQFCERHKDLRDKNSELAQLTNELKAINEALWEIENQIRAKEAAKNSTKASSTWQDPFTAQNDKRGDIKRQIDIVMNSSIVEEKQYTAYGRAE